MTSPHANYNTTEAATVLLKDFRERRKTFHVFDEYDKAMNKMRASVSAQLATLEAPIKGIAERLFAIADQGFFLFQVCEWKIDYLAEAIIHAIEAKNPISLANNVRALVEHVAALGAIAKELETMQRKLHGQGAEKAIDQALEKAEIFLHRAYHGKSPKVVSDAGEQALHVGDCLEVLREDIPEIEEAYDFLCEYVHPNHGSNALVSTGQLGGGHLNPPEEFHRETLDRLRRYCSLSMLYLRDGAVMRASIFIQLRALFDLCLVRGTKVTTVFAIKAPKPEGDGKSKETAYFFAKARTKMESMRLCYEFLAKEGYEIQSVQVGGLGHGVVFDVFDTNKGTIWFKVPMT